MPSTVSTVDTSVVSDELAFPGERAGCRAGTGNAQGEPECLFVRESSQAVRVTCPLGGLPLVKLGGFQHHNKR